MLSYVRLVEIEIHSYCNRKCAWCPNAKIDRSKFIELPEGLYLKTLEELKGLNFSGTLSFSRYNEPMSKATLLKERLNQAKEILPASRRVCNTNGDYLEWNKLNGLPIDELTIMDYDCIGLQNCLDRLRDMHARIVSINYPYVQAQHGDIAIIYFVDWPTNALLTDRGGFFRFDIYNKGNKMKLLNGQIRNIPCLEPKYFIGIDYNGDVTPCCQIRGDNPEHRKYILGNLNESPLEEIFSSRKAKKFIRMLKSNHYERYPPTCKMCSKNPGRYTRDNPGIDY